MTGWSTQFEYVYDLNEHVLIIDKEMMSDLDCQEYDVLEWEPNKDGSWTVRKAVDNG